MSIKAKIEAIIYAADEPVALDQIFSLVKEDAREAARRELETESDQSAPAAGPSSSAHSTPATEAAAPATDAELKAAVRKTVEALIAEYAAPEHGIEIRQLAGGYRIATKPEHHDTVRAFAKSLKPPVRLTLRALETLAVIAYKQPVTAPEISEIRGVDAGGVIGTLLDRKLITTAGRKQVIGRPILYRTTREFLLQFGLKDLDELPSIQEFEKLAAESLGSEIEQPRDRDQHTGEDQSLKSTEGEEKPATTGE